MATIPIMCMWDDHDIFDGWGSHDPIQNNSPVYRAIFEVAKEHFVLFQLQGDLSTVIGEKRPEGPFSCGSVLTGNVAVVLPDLRSERDMISADEGVVMSEQSWRDLERWLKNIQQEEIHHLFFVTTVPAVYPHANWNDLMLDIFNGELLDDCRDHW
jgi:hypothetical protein